VRYVLDVPSVCQSARGLSDAMRGTRRLFFSSGPASPFRASPLRPIRRSRSRKSAPTIYSRVVRGV